MHQVRSPTVTLCEHYGWIISGVYNFVAIGTPVIFTITCKQKNNRVC